MASGAAAQDVAKGKRSFANVPQTPGRTCASPSKKQPKTLKARDESQNIHPEFMGAIKRILDEKLDELTTRLTSMMDQRIAELEKKFEDVEQQITMQSTMLNVFCRKTST